MTRKVLSDADVEQFIELGYVHLSEAFPREIALRAQEDVWEHLALRGVQKEDPNTWTEPMVSLTENYDTPAFRACKTERLKNAVEDLLGIGRWRTREDHDGWGWWPVNFSYGADSAWDVPTTGWHWDGQHFRHYVHAPDQGLLLLCFFSDIHSHGGATLVAEGAHKVVAHFLNDRPEGIELMDGIRDIMSTHPWLADLTERTLSPTVCYDQKRFQAWQQSGDRVERFMNRTFVDDNGFALRIIEAIAAPGDIYLCHPFLLHSRSQNHLRVPRFLCNRTTPLYAPLSFDRPDGDYSPLETSIRQALAATAF